MHIYSHQLWFKYRLEHATMCSSKYAIFDLVLVSMAMCRCFMYLHTMGADQLDSELRRFYLTPIRSQLTRIIMLSTGLSRLGLIR